MIVLKSPITPVIDRRKRLERRDSINRSLKALGIDTIDNPDIEDCDNDAGASTSPPPEKGEMSKDCVSVASTVATSGDETKKKSKKSKKKSKSSDDVSVKSSISTASSKKKKKKKKSKDPSLDDQSVDTQKKSRKPKKTNSKDETPASAETSQDQAEVGKRKFRKPKKKKSRELKGDDDASIVSYSTAHSDNRSLNVPVQFVPGTPKPSSDSRSLSDDKLDSQVIVKKRNSFLVPTTPLTTTAVVEDFDESLRIENVPPPAPDLRRQGSVSFSDFSEMTIVDDLTDGNEDLFYNDEELAEFRHEAFLESCGLNKEDFD